MYKDRHYYWRTVQGSNIAKIRAVRTTCKICTKFTVHVYKKPVYYTSVLKTSLPYKCTQNQFTVQVYTKPAYCTSVTSVTNKERNVHGQTILRNVQGRNITKIRAVQTMCKMCTKFTVQVYKKPVYYASVHKISLLYVYVHSFHY